MKAAAAQKKKNTKSLFKRVFAWLHLWLGLASGIVVMIVSITGCIYVFQNEIRDMLEDWRFVTPRETPFLPPSKLAALAELQMQGQKASSITFGEKNEAAIAGFFSPGKGPGEKAGLPGLKIKPGAKMKKPAADQAGDTDIRRKKGGKFISLYLNPYTGELLKTKTIIRGEETDFFRFILRGHRTLWLPGGIGKVVVGVSILIFVFLLVSGIVLWWPVKWIKSVRDKSFRIKWDAKFKRLNYDLHNVFGFYSMLFLLLISLTGLVYSFQWYSKGLYWLTSGGEKMGDFRKIPKSDTTGNLSFAAVTADKVWMMMRRATPEASGMLISLPLKAADPVAVTVYKKRNTFYNADSYFFDQYTLKRLKSKSPFSGKYVEANLPDKIRRMNYDIHVGAILGMPGKILAFLASLISASLPVTGFLIWWGKKKKNKKPHEQAKAGSPKPAVKKPAIRTVLKETAPEVLV